MDVVVIWLQFHSLNLLICMWLYSLDSPGAVIKRFEQREHATDAQGVVEYLRALLLTNSISEYLPDDRSGRTSTLPTLVLYFVAIFTI